MTTEVTAEARHTGRAMRFVVLLGVVSLFADMTYEGARSVTGPFLATLGASAAVVGFVSGLGELVGYAVRLVSGYLSDRTGRYWTLTIVGYCVNLLAVPLLAWAGRWEVAVALIVAERFGKAVRTPPRDAMLSHAASRTGAGRAFGLHEALDQVGAVTGPLIVTAVLMVGGTHRTAFAILGIPAIVGISLVIAARLQYPVPRTMEVPDGGREERGGSLPPQFRLYLAGVALVAAGFADFPLMAYHFARTDAFAPQTIALVYSMAMAVDAAAALIWGRLYDRAGLRAMLIAVALSAAFAPLAFLGKGWLPLAGVALWGAGMGAQESVMRAAISRMAPAGRRGTAYGVFNSVYGAAWFAGSATMGLLYTRHPALLVAFSVVAQVLALPFIRASERGGPAAGPARGAG
ncbi:MAG: MFS transporter [Armatimonadota bacterium]|nr:MAG: MFS transporter [Armatimonadota bacterium]